MLILVYDDHDIGASITEPCPYGNGIWTCGYGCFALVMSFVVFAHAFFTLVVFVIFFGNSFISVVVIITFRDVDWIADHPSALPLAAITLQG